MARWTDLAVWRGPTVNQGGSMVEHRGLVLHTAEGSFEGTISWCKTSSGARAVSAHFVVAKDGRIAQLVDTDVTAWTQQAGNGRWLSIENEGDASHPLTAAQVEANAQLLARGHKVYGYPLQLATSPAGFGLGHHSMGTDGPTDSWTGATWGHELCPGPLIIAQKPAILARAIAIVNGDDMTPQQDALLKTTHSFTAALAAGADTYWVYPSDGSLRASASLAPYWARVAQALTPEQLAVIAGAAKEGAAAGASAPAVLNVSLTGQATPARS